MNFLPVRDIDVTSGINQSEGRRLPKKRFQSGNRSPYEYLEQAKRISNARQMITKLDRSELQDRYLCLYDDYLVIKQHARKQEEKIKR